jgi:hypothetical protein
LSRIISLLCFALLFYSNNKDIHKERLQNFVSGGTAMTSPAEDALQHLIVEEELDLQLSLLKDHIPDSTLFPDDEDEISSLPHLKDVDEVPSHQKEEMKVGGMLGLHKPTATEILAFEETVLEENLVEPIAICAALFALMMMPQLLQNM